MTDVSRLCPSTVKVLSLAWGASSLVFTGPACSGDPSSSGGAGKAGNAAAAGSGVAGSSAGTSAMGAAGSTGTGGATGGSATGGSATGGSATGGESGAAGATGAQPSCSPDYVLCEDFEASAVGSVPSGWTAHGKAAVADDQANAGNHSLKLSPADNGERRIYHPTAMLGAAHWGRVYYRVQLPTPEAFVHSTIVTFYGNGPDIGDAEFRVVDTVKDAKTGGFAGGKHQFLYNVQPNGAEFGAGSDYDYTFDDQWHCAEWHVDAVAQSVEFFYDGTQVKLNEGSDYPGAKLPMRFVEVRLGWNNYQSAPPGFTAWVDDFAVAEQRVGCLK
jgi:hypothetical protein